MTTSEQRSPGLNARLGAARETHAHIYLSSNFWDDLWIVQQPIANEIAREEPVLYVERFVSIWTVLRYPTLWKRLFSWLRGARRLSSTLHVLAPLPLFHLGHRVPWLFRLEFAIQRRWIKSFARTDKAHKRILWIDNPLYECAVGQFAEALSVYHVADEVSEFPTSNRVIVQGLERKTLAKVQLAFCAAEELTKAKMRWQPHSYTIWNAIDTSTFKSPAVAGLSSVLEGILSPRIAFVGVVDEWVDLELVLTSARELPNIRFVFVGPARVQVERLRALPNVHFLGRVDRGVVPTILRGSSASLVPFRKTLLTARIVPLKVFEALAAGIMPICTDFSVDLQTLEEAGYVRVARSVDAFIAHINAAVAADTSAQRVRLAAYGLEQTWRARWQQMSGIVDQQLAKTDVACAID